MKKNIIAVTIVMGCCLLTTSAQQSRTPAQPPPPKPFGGPAFDVQGQGLEGLQEMFQQFQQAFGGQELDFGNAGLPPAGPRTYLGARLGPVPPETAHQLDLPQGFYQLVRGVEPGSPAEKAGMEQFDIITRVDDQQIVNAQQLVQLISAKQAGDTVTVTLLRKGKEKRIKATLATTSRTASRASRGAKGQGSDFMNMMRMLQNGLGQLQQPQTPPAPRASARGATQPDIIIEEDDQGNRTTRMKSSSRSSMMHTDQGQFRFSEENGNKRFKVTDPAGNVAFDGPVNSKQDRKKVPPEFMEQLDYMDEGKDPTLPKRFKQPPPSPPRKKAI